MKYTKDMLILKGRFIKKFAEIMVKELPSWKETQTKFRKKLYSFPSICYYLLPGLFIGLFVGLGGMKCYFPSLIILFISIPCIRENIVSANKDYQKNIKLSFFENILKIFGDEIYYATGYRNYFIRLNGYDKEMDLNISTLDIQKSKLFTQDVGIVYYDDKYCGSYNNSPFKINEVNVVTFIVDNGYAKEKRLFKGLALLFHLNKNIKNRVIIVSKGNHFNKENYQKVEVEYDKFAKKYDVYVEVLRSDETSAQIEARYFLNVAFLDRFMQIQTSFKVNKMQCSIYGNDMLILLSTNKDLFEMNHLLGKIDDINQYDHLFNEFASIFSFIDVLNLSSKTKL